MNLPGRLRHPLFREPILYFVLVGAIVFAFDRALRTDERVIYITPGIRNELARTLEASLGRAAEPKELESELERWKQVEALHREGMKLGLLKNDTVVRDHVASKLLQIAGARNILPEPTEAELRNYFAQHRDSYTREATYNLDQVFVSHAHSDARARAAELLSQLRAGGAPDKLGDPFLLGHHINDESLVRLSELLGEQVAKELPGYVVGEWNLVEGKQGLHAVRLTRVDRPMPSFDQLRESLVAAVRAEQEDRAAKKYVREIEGHYRFVSSE